MSAIRVSGFIRSAYPERGFWFLREKLSGVDVFAHRDDFQSDPSLLVAGSNFTYEIVEYVLKGQKRTKAVNIRFVSHKISTAPQADLEPTSVINGGK